MLNSVELVEMQAGTIMMRQKQKIEELNILTRKEGFRSQRVLPQYITVNCRPDNCATVLLTALIIEKIEERQFKYLRMAVSYMHETMAHGIDFIRQDSEFVHMVVLLDASFASVGGLKSQLGLVVFMADKYWRTDLIHYKSYCRLRIIGLIIAADVHAFVCAFDQGCLLEKRSKRFRDDAWKWKHSLTAVRFPMLLRKTAATRY